MPEIKEIYAFIVADTGPEDEGIAAMRIRGEWFPMVGADMDRVESLRPFAEDLSKASGQKITIARFTERTNIEEIQIA